MITSNTIQVAEIAVEDLLTEYADDANAGMAEAGIGPRAAAHFLSELKENMSDDGIDRVLRYAFLVGTSAGALDTAVEAGLISPLDIIMDEELYQGSGRDDLLDHCYVSGIEVDSDISDDDLSQTVLENVLGSSVENLLEGFSVLMDTLVLPSDMEEPEIAEHPTLLGHDVVTPAGGDII